MRLEISGVDTIKDIEVQRLIWNYREMPDTDYLLKKSTEILLYTTQDTCSKFILALLPLEDGETWQAFTYVIGGETTIITGYIEGPMNVNLPTGEFLNCYSIHYERQFSGKPEKVYLAPDIGPVKFEYNNGKEEVLKNYDVR